jgi:hypothetical protein
MTTGNMTLHCAHTAHPDRTFDLRSDKGTWTFLGQDTQNQPLNLSFRLSAPALKKVELAIQTAISSLQEPEGDIEQDGLRWTYRYETEFFLLQKEGYISNTEDEHTLLKAMKEAILLAQQDYATSKEASTSLQVMLEQAQAFNYA